MKKEKDNIIIVILLLAIIGVGVYVVISKNNNKPETKVEEKQDNKEDKNDFENEEDPEKEEEKEPEKEEKEEKKEDKEDKPNGNSNNNNGNGNNSGNNSNNGGGSANYDTNLTGDVYDALGFRWDKLSGYTYQTQGSMLLVGNDSIIYSIYTMDQKYYLLDVEKTAENARKLGMTVLDYKRVKKNGREYVAYQMSKDGQEFIGYYTKATDNTMFVGEIITSSFTASYEDLNVLSTILSNSSAK
jgi:hypothetical protein